MSKIDIQKVLTKCFHIPNGMKYHRPQSGTFGGLTFGQITCARVEGRDYQATGTGAELLQAIALAQKEINNIQEAINNMVQLLESED